MKTRFIYETIIAIIGIPALIIFGSKGGIVLVLIAAATIINKKEI